MVEEELIGLGYDYFIPRPDQPERFDQQSSFYNAKDDGVSFLVGGNGAGCLGAEQEIYDPVSGISLPVCEIDGPFHVYARDSSGNTVIAKASRPKIYGTEDLYRVSLSNGKTVVVTLGHRVLTRSGWQEIGTLVRDAGLLRPQEIPVDRESQSALVESKQSDGRTKEDQQFGCKKVRTYAIPSECRLATEIEDSVDSILQFWPAQGRLADLETGAPSECRRCASRSSRTQRDFPGNCLTDHRQCDGRLLLMSEGDQEPFRQSVDVLEQFRTPLPLGDSGNTRECTRSCLLFDRLSTSRFVQPERRDLAIECASSEPCSQSCFLDNTPPRDGQSSTFAMIQKTGGPQFLAGSSRFDTSRSSLESATVLLQGEPSEEPFRSYGWVDSAYITSVEFARRDSYWDFSVDKYENYWMEGAWHHNTTETAVAKLSQFVLHEQPPPRKDTPFWIIAETYEQVCKAIWKEKLHGHGHIPECEIDWARIRWYKPNQNWPFEVPLKPWVGRPGKNWSLCFKSYKQGRGQMQAEAIGGFMFSEQFPWGLLEEVLRGCREYNFPGSKFCEFTPVDPMLSAELEELIVEDRLPPGWNVYRANTRCAMEAGHVSESWYNEFFGLISPEMRQVREIGAFASFEGAIYQSFNPLVHLAGDQEGEFPEDWFQPGVQHRRSIDWGAGPENAFVCLWGYKNGWGQWTIYDEYWSTDQTLTLHDHLMAIQDRWPWPKDHPDYGTTYADPSDVGNIRIAGRLSHYCPGYENMPLSAAYNAVYEGIDYVRWLLNECPTHKRPRLIIHKKNCPNLVREMKTYRWMRGSVTGRNPTEARGIPLKNDDHAVDALRYLTFSDARHGGGITPEQFRKTTDPSRHGIKYQRRERSQKA